MSRIWILATSVGGERSRHFAIAVPQLLAESRKNLWQRKQLCYSSVIAIKFARGDKFRLACSSDDGTLSVCGLAPSPPSVSCTLRGHTAAVTGRCYSFSSPRRLGKGWREIWARIRAWYVIRDTWIWKVKAVNSWHRIGLILHINPLVHLVVWRTRIRE